jgi:NADH-quinone oxidoreductase subunit L
MIHVATILFPLLASLVIALMYRLPEKYIKFFARAFGLLSSILAINSALHWSEYLFAFTFFEHDFFLDLNYDQTSAVFSLLTAFCGAVIIHFSSFYLHKEKGFARFFSLIFLLISGMHILSMADNLFSFFIGWEFLGIASYFLISFYWQRKESVNSSS